MVTPNPSRPVIPISTTLPPHFEAAFRIPFWIARFVAVAYRVDKLVKNRMRDQPMITDGHQWQVVDDNDFSSYLLHPLLRVSLLRAGITRKRLGYGTSNPAEFFLICDRKERKMGIILESHVLPWLQAQGKSGEPPIYYRYPPAEFSGRKDATGIDECLGFFAKKFAENPDTRIHHLDSICFTEICPSYHKHGDKAMCIFQPWPHADEVGNEIVRCNYSPGGIK